MFVKDSPVYFNPRSYKRSDWVFFTKQTKRIYFNPRSYKRSDSIIAFTVFTHFISIHAPTRGATKKSLCGRLSSYYFNPRSYKRSDLLKLSVFFLFLNFNPRSYKRSDHFSSFLCAKINISIHAPTRGATTF